MSGQALGFSEIDRNLNQPNSPVREDRARAEWPFWTCLKTDSKAAAVQGSALSTSLQVQESAPATPQQSLSST